MLLLIVFVSDNHWRLMISVDTSWNVNYFINWCCWSRPVRPWIP